MRECSNWSKWVIRTAKERHPGTLGYAEAMMVAYNTKKKFRLSIRKLHGGKASSRIDEEEEMEEEES